MKNGFKWSLEQLKFYLRDRGVDIKSLWAKIEMIVILTLINLCSLIPNLDCCMELFGFDIMIDSNLKPWLIEVNSSPAMSNDCELDWVVKSQLLKDTFGLAKIQTYK